MLRISLTLLACLLLACAHAGVSDAGASIVLMDRTPLGCDRLRSVEGIGADAERALEEARNQAANEGGTHIVAGRPHVDVEHGMFTALPATVFKCPPDWTQPPANGYP